MRIEMNDELTLFSASFLSTSAWVQYSGNLPPSLFQQLNWKRLLPAQRRVEPPHSQRKQCQKRKRPWLRIPCGKVECTRESLQYSVCEHGRNKRDKSKMAPHKDKNCRV